MAWSSKKKRGRPAKVTTQKWDYGNDRVQARAALFRHFGGESALGFETTCAGRLMIVGAFDGLPSTPEESLMALLAYSDGYWGNFGGGARVAQYERSDRSQDTSDYLTPDPRGEWFDAMDERLRNAGHEVRRAVHQCSVDRHWFPDMDCFWAQAIINRRIVDKRAEFVRAKRDVPAELKADGLIALDGDSAWHSLELLRLGAAALIDNRADTRMRRAA